MEIRNIAIIAHVDHGKTTLTDAIMAECGHGNEGSMDSNALEQERGITIYAKNTSVMYKGTKINIVDTPGHADFGSEVERVLRSIDTVLLVVDAQEGPMPQTRFVLKKSLELGLKPIVVINKIDKPAANPMRTHDKVLELFMELGANNEQINFPTVYAIGRQGIAKKSLTDESKDLSPLLDTILKHVLPSNRTPRLVSPLVVSLANKSAPVSPLGASPFVFPANRGKKSGEPSRLTGAAGVIVENNISDESASAASLSRRQVSTLPERSGGKRRHFVGGEKGAGFDAVSRVVLKAQVFNLDYDNFLGRLAIARIYDGAVKDGQNVWIKDVSGKSFTGKVTKLFTFEGKKRVEIKQAESGDIVTVAGIPDIYIGETITDDEKAEPLPAITVDEPTISLQFLVNNSPFAGREGTFVTGRQIRERLERELETNVGLKVDFSSRSDLITVYGRGELHIAILLETMRREGYELQVSQPKVIIKEVPNEAGELVKSEPFEELIIDCPGGCSGAIIETLGCRKGIMNDMKTHGNQVRMVFEIPTRGLLGYSNIFIIDTKGEGIMASRVIGFKPYAGLIQKRETGSMISMASGKALGFSLWNLQDRGTLYISPAMEVYEGMVIGNTSKGEEMTVNPTKGKQLTNMRASGSDEAIMLTPPLKLTIERGLEIMAEDEYLEITPVSVRLRKQFLTELDRARAGRKDI